MTAIANIKCFQKLARIAIGYASFTKELFSEGKNWDFWKYCNK